MSYSPIVLLCLITTMFACSKRAELPEPLPTPVVDTIQPMPKYLALGDSYTIGQNVSIEERFPHQSVARLKQLNKTVATPEYIATTGWTTGNLLNAIASAAKPKNYDMVSLLIGVNNQFQRRDTAEYRKQFSECLDQAILHAANKKERVFVISIPDYSVTPFGMTYDSARITREIDIFNTINEQVTKSYGIVYINITPGSKDAASDRTLVANDGLHPSGKEYRKWAELLATQAAKVLP